MEKLIMVNYISLVCCVCSLVIGIVVQNKVKYKIVKYPLIVSSLIGIFYILENIMNLGGK